MSLRSVNRPAWICLPSAHPARLSRKSWMLLPSCGDKTFKSPFGSDNCSSVNLVKLSLHGSSLAEPCPGVLRTVRARPPRTRRDPPPDQRKDERPELRLDHLPLPHWKRRRASTIPLSVSMQIWLSTLCVCRPSTLCWSDISRAGQSRTGTAEHAESRVGSRPGRPRCQSSSRGLQTRARMGSLSEIFPFTHSACTMAFRRAPPIAAGVVPSRVEIERRLVDINHPITTLRHCAWNHHRSQRHVA